MSKVKLARTLRKYWTMRDRVCLGKKLPGYAGVLIAHQLSIPLCLTYLTIDKPLQVEVQPPKLKIKVKK